MNKKKVKKLSLNKEVLRNLTQDELGKAAGGFTMSACMTVGLDCSYGYEETLTAQGC